MGKATDITWTDHTFNPWWGCHKVSEGCDNCYAETFAKRVGQAIWGPPATTQRRTFGDAHWAEPLKWDRDARTAGVRRRVFCASMADVFEAHGAADTARPRLWQLIQDTPNLDWLLLTKRPERLVRTVPWMVANEAAWPNVWLGTSAENQEWADKRIPHLLRVRAVVRFISAEPLLGPIEFSDVTRRSDAIEQLGKRALNGIHWVIVGGESGPKHRPFDPDWARSLRDQCQAAGVAYHFKQHGGRTHAEGGRLLDGRTWDEFPEVAA